MSVSPIKILSQFFNVILRTAGVMNKDVDPRDVKNGDFIDALNTRSLTDTGQTTNSRQNILGNELVFAVSPISLQDKKFRIYLDKNTTAPNRILNIYDANSNLLGTALWTTNINFNITYLAAINAITTTFTSDTFVFSALTTVSTTEAYFDMEITTVPYWDYSIEFIVTNPFSALPEKLPVTIQEAIDQSLVGEWNLIRSYDLQGELILWWTTQKNLPFDYDILSITNNGSGKFRIKTTVNHGLLSNENVIVKNSGLANGSWIITVVSADEFDLNGSVYSAVTVTSDSKVTVDPQGIGELGRAVKDEQTQTWTYTRLVRAKKLNWVTKHQQDTLCKKDALRKYYRFTDDYNNPGTLYDRTLVYQDDCLLNFVDPRNTYSYDNIGREVRFLQANTDVVFRFTSQDQSGGAILSGNSQAFVRLITDTLVPTTWSEAVNCIPATSTSETGTPNLFSGDDANIVTPKIDNFSLSGDLLDNYKWAQIAIVNYQGDAVTGLLLPKVLLTSDDMILRWIGTEATEDLDVGTLNAVTTGYKTALSIDELDGRLILSNLTSSTQYDLSDFAQSLTHSVKRYEIPTVGSPITSDLSINEYDLSDNVTNRSGYMINETERFGLIAEFWDGGESLVYHIQDIRIDTDVTYPRRVAALPDENLTDSTASVAYVPYVQFSNINWNFLIDGVLLKDIVKRLRIVRVYLDENLKEVYSGVAVMGVTGIAAYTNVDAPSTYTGGIATITSTFISDYPFAEGVLFPPTVNNQNYSSYLGTLKGDYASVYIFDDMYGLSSWTPLTTDIVRNLSQPDMIYTPVSIGSGSGANLFWNNMAEFTGFSSTAPNNLTISAGARVGFGQGVTIGGNVFYKQSLANYFNAGFPIYTGTATVNYPTSPVVKLTAPIIGVGALDRGFRRVQVIRSKPNKFGSDPALSRYVSTGASLDDTSITTLDVFGGQVMTQKTWFRHRMVSDFTQNIPTFVVSGFGGGIGCYTQNYVNTDMTNRNSSGDEWKYPATTEVIWLNTITTADPNLTYNQGYNIKNIRTYAAYNTDQTLFAYDFPVRLIYSEKVQPEQASDTQRIFLPLNFTDLEYKHGEIVHHRVINSELYTWQPEYFDQLYFHSNTLISTTSGSEVITGSGGAFTNRPKQLTQYGCANKWAILIGRSQGGKQTAYWPSTRLRTFVRHGYDGTTNQSLIHGMDSFFRYNLSMVIGKDKPADGQGICCVWNEAFKEAIYTVRGWRDSVSQYDNTFNYLDGMVVQYGTTGFEQVPAFYQSKANGNLGNLPTDILWWTPIPLTNGNYYNVYSFVFSEVKNGFDGFVSFKPKIYAPYDNTILSPRPVSNTSQMYEHNRGTYCVWYDNGTTSQAENGTTRVVFNADSSSTKEMKAVRFRTLVTPYHVNFKTLEHESYLDAADFELRESKYDAAIQCDSTVTTVPSIYGAQANPLGLNNLDTTCPIYGDYLEIELVFQYGVKQVFDNVIIHGELSDRRNNT